MTTATVNKLYSVRGGVGCTTTAALLAMVATDSGERVLLVGGDRDVTAILGVPPVDPNIGPRFETTLHSGGELWVVGDAESVRPEWCRGMNRVVVDDGVSCGEVGPMVTHTLVTRGDYLSARHLVDFGRRVSESSGIAWEGDKSAPALVVVCDPARALSARDVASAARCPLDRVTGVTRSPNIARWTDAGMLCATMGRLRREAAWREIGSAWVWDTVTSEELRVNIGK